MSESTNGESVLRHLLAGSVGGLQAVEVTGATSFCDLMEKLNVTPRGPNWEAWLKLVPEMLRNLAWEEFSFLDEPDPEKRRTMLRAYLSKRGYYLGPYELGFISSDTDKAFLDFWGHLGNAVDNDRWHESASSFQSWLDNKLGEGRYNAMVDIRTSAEFEVSTWLLKIE